ALRIGGGHARPRERLGQLRRGQRMRLDGDEVQTIGPASILAPGRQRGEEVRPDTEAELEDREGRGLRPPFTQAGAADEDRLGLRKRPRSALVDVAEGRAQQAPGGIAGKPAGFDWQGGTGSIGKAGMISGSIPGPGPSAARTAAIASRAGDGTAGLAAFRPADVLRVADALGRA